MVLREEYDLLAQELYDTRRMGEESAELEREIREELEADISRRDAEIKRLKTRITLLEEQNEGLQAKLRNMLEERGSLTNRLENLKLSEQKLKRLSVSLEQDNEGLESNLRIKESNNSVLEERYTALVEENAFLLARVEEAEERVQRLKDTNRELEEDIAALSAKAQTRAGPEKGEFSSRGARDRQSESASTLLTGPGPSSASGSMASLPSAPSLSGPVSKNLLSMTDSELKNYIKIREAELSQEERDLETLRKLVRARTEKKLSKLRSAFAFTPSSPRSPSRRMSGGGPSLSRRISRLFLREPQS